MIRNPFTDGAGKVIRLVKSKKDGFWSKEQERQSLNLFHEAARRVPAYKNFLKKNRVQPDKIRTFKDFTSLPTTSKKEYLVKYPLEQLCWDGSLKKPLGFSSTSGSTGQPFYFPRGYELEWQYSVITELFSKNGSRNSNGPTLVIIGFSMGVWIGGLITEQAFRIASQRNSHPLSIITPGINKGEIFKAMRLLAPRFSQVILVGYPPFVKDILDEAPARGINLKKLNLRLMFAAEPFTEKFRDYLTKKGCVKNAYRDTLNVYGSADIGAMAFESPLSILVRRLALKRKDLFEDIFSPISKTPTLAQYIPSFINFEAVNGEILLTGDNSIPLIRYAIGDHGGVFGFDEVRETFMARGVDLEKEAKKAGLENFLYQLPFVYVYERTDMSTTLYGLQIYPETIREVLIDKPLNKYLTGKFSMMTKFDQRQNQYLEINLELRKHKKATPHLKKTTLLRIFSGLRAKNSEFKELSNYIGERALPRLVFWPAEHSLHFKPGAKQKWIKS